LKLALKALPYKIDEHNIYRIEMINFFIIQQSLIDFQNDDQDELFNFYDNRNKTRLRKLSRRAAETETQTEDLKKLANSVLSIMNKIIAMAGYIKNGPSTIPDKLKGLFQQKQTPSKNVGFLPPIDSSKRQ